LIVEVHPVAEQVADEIEKHTRALAVARDFINRVLTSSQRGEGGLPLEIANDALLTRQRIASILQDT
jgi:hypothetical protein